MSRERTDKAEWSDPNNEIETSVAEPVIDESPGVDPQTNTLALGL